MYGIEGKLKYKIEENVNRKKYRCDSNETMESYTKCAFNELTDYGCSTSINKIGSNFNETNICTNITEFYENQEKTYKELSNILYGKSSSKCKKPCKIASFDISLEKMHQNDQLIGHKYSYTIQNGMFKLNFNYDDFLIETKQEYLVMDGPGLISTIGGFLGLLLGSSCISIIDWFANHFQKCMK